MEESLMGVLEQGAALLALVLMGACGAGLLLRFVRVLRGHEAADGLPAHGQHARAAELWAAAGAALLSRLALYALAYAMYRMLGLGSDGPLASLEPLWTHWDTRHYVGIAQEGYTAVGDERLRLVFFPLYPWLMRLLAPLTGGNVFLAGVVISLACSAAAAAMVYDLSCMHFGRETARRSVAYFLLSPLSVFLCCAYTEALFIALTLAAVCLLRRGHPWAAALCGALSALTRMPGVIVSGLLLIAFCAKIPRRKADGRALLVCVGQVLLVFSGLFVYWLVNWRVTGDPMTYMTYQRENWFQEPGAFWRSTANTMHYFLSTAGESDWLWTWGFQLACMLGIYVLLAVGARRIPFDLAAYSFVYTAVVLSPTWLLSGARYLYALCALPMLLARLRVGRTGHTLLLGVSGVLLAVWTFGYCIAVQVL